MTSSDDTPDTPTTDADARLASYLRDHHSLVTSELALAERAVRANIGTEYETPLRGVLEDAGHDLVAVSSVLEVLGVEISTLRTKAVRLGEMLGRLKFNGPIQRGYSPSSRVLEIEALVMLLQGRLALCQTLRTALSSDELPDDVDVNDLEQRTASQLETLRNLHRQASQTAFAGLTPPSQRG